jgi:hypothetical protein
MSASRTAVLNPFFFNFEARRAVTRDFPTPPLPETIPITFLTQLPSRRVARKSLDLQFEPQLEQSCVHPSAILVPLFQILFFYKDN